MVECQRSSTSTFCFHLLKLHHSPHPAFQQYHALNSIYHAPRLRQESPVSNALTMLASTGSLEPPELLLLTVARTGASCKSLEALTTLRLLFYDNHFHILMRSGFMLKCAVNNFHSGIVKNFNQSVVNVVGEFSNV